MAIFRVASANSTNKRRRDSGFISSSASVAPRLAHSSLSDDAVSSHGAADKAENTDLSQLQITDRPELPPKTSPKFFVSYAWGDDSSDDARQRTEVVDRLCETLGQHGWHILRDSTVLHPGELISGFMKRIGLADHVIVVISDKYLRSPYCMTELHSVYPRSTGEKEDFLRRIVPLVLKDARFGTPEKRVQYAKHWETRYLKLKSNLDYLSVEDFRLYQDMKRWHLDVGNI